MSNNVILAKRNENRLLAVDGDGSFCQLLKKVGIDLGYDVETTSNLQDFKDAYQRFDPTFITMDLNIFDKDGMELLRFLAEERCRKPITLISNQDERVRLSAIRFGKGYGLEMVSHKQKPIDIGSLKQLFTAEMNRNVLPTEEALGAAIQRHEFVMHYQPMIDFKTNKLVSIEALVRWTPPNGEMIFPDAFIPIAEQTGLIVPLTFWVIKTVFRQRAQWDMLDDVTVSINLSSKILGSIYTADEIIKLAKDYKLNPKKISFEITEIAVMSQPATALDVLTRLRAAGFQISLDDFGIGYSSLIQIHRLPLTEIKIDKSFGMCIPEDEQACKIAKSIIDLGHSLGISVVAEGVESKEAFDKLRKLGCDIAQGYYIRKPLRASEFEYYFLENKDNG